MSTAQVIIIFTIVAYLFGMLMIGVAFSRQGAADSSDSFYIGGRGLGPLVTAMSAEASDMSSWLLMGLPGLVYLTGVAEAGWTAIGLAVGTYLNFLFVARLLRRYSEKINAFTIPDFYSRRYGDRENTLSLVAALIIIIFFIPYTASGFKAVGTLFNSLFGVEYHLAMIAGALIIVTYTTMGGFLAVSTTDLVQSIFMTIALIVIIFFGIDKAGGLGVVMDNAKALPGYLNIMQGYDAGSKSASSYGPLTIASTLAWGLGYFGMPHILLRFMAIRDEKELVLSRRIASVWVVLSMGIAMFIGIIGYSVSLAGGIDMLTGSSAESETVIMKIAALMSQQNFLFAILAGVILAGILAATMSTADSQLLAASSSVSEDLMQNFGRVSLTQQGKMIAARATVVAIAVVAIILAWNPNSSVFRVVSFAWAGFGATFGPTMLLALFWRRSNRQGALAGLIVGGVMIFVWKFKIAGLGGVFAIYELLPAFLFALLADIIVSLVTKEPSAVILKQYDEVHRR